MTDTPIDNAAPNAALTSGLAQLAPNTNSTTSTDKTQATGPSDGQDSTSGAPAQPSKTENAGDKADAGAVHSDAEQEQTSGAGEKAAAPAVAQDVFDRLHADFLASQKALAQTTAERDEAKAYAGSLSDQLASQARDFEQKLTAAGANFKSALKDSYADVDEETSALETELAAIKARVHAGIDEAKALASRLADIVPVNHPGRALEAALAHLKAKVVELL